jgi:hypothetical protein
MSFILEEIKKLEKTLICRFYQPEFTTTTNTYRIPSNSFIPVGITTSVEANRGQWYGIHEVPMSGLSLFRAELRLQVA